MALVLFRGITRCYRVPLRPHQIAVQNFSYSTKPSPKETSKPIEKSTCQAKSPEDGKKLVNDKKLSPLSSSQDDKPLTPRETAQQKYEELKTKISESQRKAETVREDIRGYALERFINYVKNYDKVLEKKFPGAMKVYRVFMDGVKFFGRDMVSFVKIRSSMVLDGKDISELSRQELELYYQVPRDMRKVAPILIVSSIPFAHYVTMPIAYYYPRKLLTHHFWTLQQRSEFAVINLRDRVMHNRPVFRYLQSKLPQLKNDPHYEPWRELLGKLGSGVHPSTKEILAVKTLFSETPYHTRALPYTHIKNLCGLHDVRTIFFKKSSLAYKAMVIHLLDKAILREGGTKSLATPVLRDSCFLRGLNASNMDNEELLKWLDQWIEISSHIDEKNFSLLLHLPILTTYNHPNNWKLKYQERDK